MCDAYRLDSHLADFWTAGLNASNCNSGLGLPPDSQYQYRSTGFLSVTGPGLFPGPLGEHSTVAAGAFPADLPATPISMSYEVAANIAGLARTSIGKAGGTSLDYVVPGYRMNAPSGGPGTSNRVNNSGETAVIGTSLCAETLCRKPPPASLTLIKQPPKNGLALTAEGMGDNLIHVSRPPHFHGPSSWRR